MERVPLHDREMEISIQYHVMLIHQSNDQILMRCYIKSLMACLKSYFCFCGVGLKRFESKDGRGFVRCRTETCTLFTAEEKYTELVEVFQTKVNSKFKPNNFPLCECGEVASFWVPHSAENPCRPFSDAKRQT